MTITLYTLLVTLYPNHVLHLKFPRINKLDTLNHVLHFRPSRFSETKIMCYIVNSPGFWDIAFGNLGYGPADHVLHYESPAFVDN